MDTRSLGGVGCAVASLLFLMTGCGKESLPGPKPFPVRGSVMYRGQPAQKLRLAFFPIKEFEKVRFAPSAITDEKGEFLLRSYKPGDGAPAGDYMVTFVWPDHINTGDENDPTPEVDHFKGFYADPQKSQFRVTIQEGENKLPPFALQ